MFTYKNTLQLLLLALMALLISCSTTAPIVQDNYLVVNLVNGSSHYTDVAPDLTDDTCRTTELWLRKIPKGTFTMGSPTDEEGRADDETQHQVTLTEDFYIGVFEITQRQFELIYGSNPSKYTGDTRPVERVSYDDIRGSSKGAGWPSSHDVDDESFLGKLRYKTRLSFDLPTEAQWEYACRAGTTTALNTGKNLTSTDQDSAMDEAGRYYCNTSDGKGGYDRHTKVGSYLPNNWGLYDMHGNVFEWCLDWCQSDLGSAAVTNPLGDTSGLFRGLRGGSWSCSSARLCRSAYRFQFYPSRSFNFIGFRVALLPAAREVDHVLTVEGVWESVPDGTTVSKDAPLKDGYVFQNWTATGLADIDIFSNPLSFTMPANDVILSANYMVNSYTLTVEGVDEQVDYTTSVSKTAATKEGYTFTGWTITGVTVEDASAATISFAMPANDVTLTPNYLETSTLYLVVNLETGASHYSETAPDLTYDTCRTTELWLRKIPAGTFTMGSPADEVGHESDETQHQVTLSEDFYIGVFEMTQKQYELIYGSNPSEYTGDTRPVETVSYNTLRGSSTGAGWPASHDVDSTSFLGKLRSKTGLVFDLPTEAQWEYACRAGTSTALNTGKNLTSIVQDSAMDEAGRYSRNQSDAKGENSAKHTKVGSYLPNNWGLYDMHGNVWEWCLDWYLSALGSTAVTDPVGDTLGLFRVIRGGGWCGHAGFCRSAFRNSGFSPFSSDSLLGFRVVFLPAVQEVSYVLTVDGVVEFVASGTTVSKSAPLKEGYVFQNWTVTGLADIDTFSNPLSFTMPANDVILSANIVNSFTLTVDGVEEQVDYNTSVSKTADTKEGYTFTGWTITGVTVEDASATAISFAMPANDVILSANYMVNSYTLTVDGVEEQVDYSTSVSKTAAMKEGNFFRGWTVDGVTVEDASAATISFGMPANDVTLMAAYSAIPLGTYYVVNLETGEGRSSSSAPDLTDDICRTTELWLRRIPAGTFTMGSPTSEVGRYDRETQHQVTLTEDFYIGVFEMTQKQYELIYGSNPSYYRGDTRPVERVSYNTIRGSSTGAGWPASHDVDSDSFLGKLRSKTGLSFDLPTEAQWEYACRAGTTTALNTGKNLTDEYEDPAMGEAGRYNYNSSESASDGKGGYDQHTKVGSYLPNNWGLYDMHGNVWEWCLDWDGGLGSAAVTDPVGGGSGSYRVFRGGSWYDSAQCNRSSFRDRHYPFHSYSYYGFRVVFVPSVQ